jgi:hypothetical protein
VLDSIHEEHIVEGFIGKFDAMGVHDGKAHVAVPRMSPAGQLDGDRGYIDPHDAGVGCDQSAETPLAAAQVEHVPIGAVGHKGRDMPVDFT